MAYGPNAQDSCRQDIPPYLAAMMFAHTGHPTLGRRYMGFGASPFYAGGPVPVHQMNRLVHGMQPHGMSRSRYGAGEYPFPRHPYPLGYGARQIPFMPMGFSVSGAGGLMPSNCCNSMMGFGWPGSMMGTSNGSGGLGGMGGLSGMGAFRGMNSVPSMCDFGSIMSSPCMMNNFMSGGLPVSDDDDDDEDDDDGAWDPEPEEDDPFALYIRAVKKGRRKKGKSLNFINPMFGMPLMGAGMFPPLGCM